MTLFPPFLPADLEVSSTAQRAGIDNTAPPELLANATRLGFGLGEVQNVLGHPIHIDSGYRCEALEHLLCVKDFSHWCGLHSKDPATAWPEYFARKQHPKFQAADFTCPQFGTPVEIVTLISKSTIQFDQCIQEGTWVHISFSDAPRREVLTASFSNGVASYSGGNRAG
jgi:hypothetical protein